MPARRVACPTPWGEVHDLVVMHGRVVVPEELAYMRSLQWLGAEHHPRVAVTALGVLERATGAALGPSPYCVGVTRWNDAARNDPWLPIVAPSSDAKGMSAGPPDAAEDAPLLPLPNLSARSYGAALGPENGFTSRLLIRLHEGGAATASVANVVGAPFHAMLQIVAVAAAAYYLLTVASWLWGLQEGMDGAELQVGILVLLVRMLLSSITRALWDRAADTDGYGADARDDRRIQVIVDTTLGMYRFGILLQVLAFAGFLMF
jgi:hypothetical protein